MNKLILLSALFACVLFVSVARADNEVENEIESSDDEGLLEGGFRRNPVGKEAGDLWGLDIHERGLPRAVEERERMCKGIFVDKTKCKTCCEDKGHAWSFARMTGKCTCHQTNNHYMQ